MEDSLISAIFKHKPIWDPSDKLRKNSKILSNLWIEVANEVGVNVKVARSKWKNLRAYYAAELRKIRKSSTGSHGSMKMTSSWAHFNQLMFLKDTIGTIDEARDDSLYTQDDTDCSHRISVECLIEDGTEQNFPPIYEESETETISQPTTIQTGKQNGPKDNEYASSSSSNFLLHRLKTNERILDKTGIEEEHYTSANASEFLAVKKRKVELLEKEFTLENDPDLHFFKSLLPYMADFNPVEKLRIRSKIQEIILTEYERKERGE